MSRAPSFLEVGSLDRFFDEPARRVVVHRSFAYWQAERRAFGSIIWGRPDSEDVAQMAAAHEVGAHPLFRGHTSLVDIRALESVDLLAFARLLAYVVARRDAWSPNVSRQVVLYEGGYAHAVVLGMFGMLRPSHPVVFFDDPDEAYAAVGADDVQNEVEAIRTRILGLTDVVRRVQRAMDDLPVRASARTIAAKVGMSVRSLQRHLAQSGTSLTEQRQKHVVRASERLLAGTELDLAAIAAEVGASSAPHLVALFRRHHGTTPGEFRAAQRAAQK